MPAKNAKRLQLSARRKEVAHLYTQGFTQMHIAERLGVSQATVSGDLKRVEKQWRADAVRDFDHCREHELQKLSLIEQEAWQAWERSQKPQQSADLTGDDSSRPTKKRIRNQYGDPRFLALVNQCIATRRALLGLDLVPVPAESGQHANLEERRSRVVALIASLEQRRGVGGGGTMAGLEQPGDVRPAGDCGYIQPLHCARGTKRIEGLPVDYRSDARKKRTTRHSHYLVYLLGLYGCGLSLGLFQTVPEVGANRAPPDDYREGIISRQLKG